MLGGLARTTALAVLLIAGAGFAHAQEPDKLKFTLNWTPDAGHAPYFLAEELGYYADANLDVEIELGRGSATTTQLVAAGQTDVGLADAATVIGLAARGAPVKIIGIDQQVSGWALIVAEDSDIKEPKDLEGHSIGITPGSAVAALYSALVAANDIDASTVDVVNFDPAAQLNMLTEGEIDSTIDVLDIEAPRMMARGWEPRGLYLRDHGVPLFGIVIIATEETIAERPDVLRRFLEASAKGLKAAMEDNAAAADLLLKLYPDAGKREDIMFTLEQRSANTWCSDQSVGVLEPSTEHVEASYEVMTSYLDVPSDNPIGFYYKDALLPEPPVACP